ncbi:hypothetical protein QEG98_02350 [Myxococcus sp. MxC21-1]|uniref:hypothetical protein n=1 Tax=Myxococcus sp. MxC21-1 TaxID=3041439 RepID=UPI002931CC7F|nr:hypothetical protein [Myxococcus sp. MxC21-1]WNZ62689.1 hypothetical protein QEG98_02350 [Myxococcus sp. MxC21-1]
MIPTLKECSLKLSLLDGTEFQTAVTSLVSKNFHDFQAIPAAPHGDGGLDGLAQSDTHGYCCYGIEDAQKQDAKALASALVDKFKGDLLRLCEFDRKKKVKLAPKENKALENILPQGKKIKHIYLVCNTFKHHTSIKKLKDYFEKIKKQSQCRFIDQTCGLTIEGPDEITNRLAVPPDFHATIELAALLKLLAAPSAAPSTPPELTAFEQKMDVLAQKFGAARISPIDAALRKEWLAHLELLERLNQSLPNDHLRIHRITTSIRRDAAMYYLGIPIEEAIKKTFEFEQLVCKRLMNEVPLPEAEAQSVAKQVVASLIGECGIEWRPNI